jgi:phage terminase large subunit-like protein
LDPRISQLRSDFQSKSKDQQQEYLQSLSITERKLYYKNPDIFLFDKQIIPEGNWRYFLLRCGRGFGKDIDITTEIPTPDGWKTMFDLQVGDKVFNEKGEIVNVVWVSEIFTKNQCYKLTFSTGEEVIAGEDHQWLTSTHYDRKNANRRKKKTLDSSIKTTRELFLTQTQGKDTNHSIPLAQAIQYSTKELLIDPYVLGCWLGDGSKSSAQIECADIEMLKEINKSYSTTLLPSSIGQSKSCAYRIGEFKYYMQNKTPHKASELFLQLKSMNLIKNKHIPTIYLQSDIEQRIALLQGLMDTDGCCLSTGVMEFCNSNKLLAYQVYELISSLGIKATIHQNESWLYDLQCSDRYRINFTTNKQIFRLQRKLNNIRQTLSFRYNNRYIQKIEKVETVPTKCIMVDGESHLYLITKSFIPTHNSFSGSAQVVKWIRQGAQSIGLIGPTYSDVQDTMVPMIVSWFLSTEFLDSKHPYSDFKIRLKSGAIIYCYSSEVEKKGPNLEYLWCDEIATWCQGQPEKIQLRFEDMARAVRVGHNPQIIITSTPKTHPFFTNFQKQIDNQNPKFQMIQGSMLENPTLSREYISSEISLYGNTSRGRQEIYGDLITDNPGAYWTHQQIDALRVVDLPGPLIAGPPKSQPLTNDQLMGRAPKPTLDPTQPYLIRVVIGFDPSGSSQGDECGIIVAALYSNKEAYVLRDASGSLNPNEYAKLISDLYSYYHASTVVVETNFGGKETFQYVLRSVNAAMKITPRHNSQGKTTRAEHISSLYSMSRVHHVGAFPFLEDQMCSFNVDYTKSPDRLDALGLAVTELFWPTGPSGNKISILNLPSYR